MFSSLRTFLSLILIFRAPAPDFVSGAAIGADVDTGALLIPNVHDPEAVNAQSVCPGYKASGIKRTQHGLTASLSLAGAACNVYGTDVNNLTLTVEYHSADRLSINIQPANLDSTNYSWFVLPEYLVPSPRRDYNAMTSVHESDVGFFLENNPTFSLSMLRKSTGDVLFSTSGTKLVYEDQFIEFVSPLPANYNLYGLGETMHAFRLGNNLTRTIYAADSGDTIDANIYGSHPFYVDTRYYEKKSTGGLTLVANNITDPGKHYVSYSHGLYNRNAHGQEILLSPTNITWRALGGSIDLHLYAGPTVPDVVAAHQKAAAGLPALQKYHTFGYHQCRWGYRNWSEIEQVVKNFAKFEIPLEHIWTDIDYMFQYRNFMNDPIRFAYDDGRALLRTLTARGQHYIPILDSAIYIPNPDDADDVYPSFAKGNITGSHLLNPDGSLYIGKVWPGYTVYPDWLPGSGAHQWWIGEIAEWHRKINWSGIWIDMSEASSFCVGSCGSGKLDFNIYGPSSGSDRDTFVTVSTTTTYMRTTPTPGIRNVDHPPYVINHVHGDLAVHAVSPNATHHNGVQEYDVHSLFGHTILKATYDAMLQVSPGKRPFIIGRSTFVGSGKWAGHWGGDNAASFEYMYLSIPQALSFSLFGIPMFGVDTCGFSGNSDEELCNRWMQLSAFFPFYRNHNALSGTSQEPYIWPSVTAATKIAMAIRFRLLPYMYTLFYLAHTTGSTVMRALSWEFPNDPSLASADLQFFLGPAVLVTPVLARGKTSVDGVFPGIGQGETYYDWYTLIPVRACAGENVTINAPLGHIPVYVRGGNIIPMQQPAMTTISARKTPWSLLVALGSKGAASGSLYLDDGESIRPPATLKVGLVATHRALYASALGSYHDKNPLSNVTVLGVPQAPRNVRFNGNSVAPPVTVYYNCTSMVMIINGLEGLTNGGAWRMDWVLTWQDA